MLGGKTLCLSQQPWQSLARADGKVTVIAFMGAFIHPIVSPWSEGLVRSAGGWGTVQGQRTTLEVVLGKPSTC